MLLAPTSHPIRVCSLALPPPPPRKLKRTYDAAQILSGVAQLEALLPGPPPFAPNMEAMKASDWVGGGEVEHEGKTGWCMPPPSLAPSHSDAGATDHAPPCALPSLVSLPCQALVLLDTQSVANRLVQLKIHFPGVDVLCVNTLGLSPRSDSPPPKECPLPPYPKTVGAPYTGPAQSPPPHPPIYYNAVYIVNTPPPRSHEPLQGDRQAPLPAAPERRGHRQGCGGGEQHHGGAILFWSLPHFGGVCS